jgi:endonuclease YncB( thermonuclease family)
MWKSIKRSFAEAQSRLLTVPSVKTITNPPPLPEPETADQKQTDQTTQPDNNGQQPKKKQKASKKQKAPKLQQYIPDIKYARVASVYDGDTITIATTKRRFFSPSATYAFKVRIAKIDCPELRGSPPAEHQYALLAKEFVSYRIDHKVVKLDIQGYDKYGRLLADVYYTEPNPIPIPHANSNSNSKYGTNLAEALLAEGLAVPYDGKTKAQPDWESVFQDAKLAREEAMAAASAASASSPSTPPSTPSSSPPSTSSNPEAALEMSRTTPTKSEPTTEHGPKSDTPPANESE